MDTNRKVLVVEKVYNEVKNRILSGQYLPGMHLVEAELTAEFKVSRVTMRDALRRLVADELVDSVPNSGMRVKRLSYEDILELYAVREVIEGLSARLAAQLPAEKLVNLQDICIKGADAVARKDRLEHRHLNNLFHQELALATGNRTLVKILERLKTQMIGNQFMPLMTDEDIAISQRDHETMIKVIMAGDGEQAEKIMRKHIKTGRDFALSCIPKPTN